MWVGLIQPVKNLKRKRLKSSEEEGILPSNCNISSPLGLQPAGKNSDSHLPAPNCVRLPFKISISNYLHIYLCIYLIYTHIHTQTGTSLAGSVFSEESWQIHLPSHWAYPMDWHHALQIIRALLLWVIAIIKFFLNSNALYWPLDNSIPRNHVLPAISPSLSWVNIFFCLY